MGTSPKFGSLSVYQLSDLNCVFVADQAFPSCPFCDLVDPVLDTVSLPFRPPATGRPGQFPMDLRLSGRFNRGGSEQARVS